MDEQQKQLIDRIQQAQNILVSVSTNPSVDQLSAAIGLTLVLNHLNKHGTAVFSGEVPSTIEFLKPEETLEKNTDSLRDFIVALDKSKADKLRYKVEDDVVRIFITPYKTSISEKDLDFSQGDFNVDVVVCLGVTEQQDLDGAITAHGRILHDATVVSISTVGQGRLGSINWVDPSASSLSEMMVSLADGLDKKIIDSQIATALLTGIVASTDRFSNDKTSPRTMSASAELMAAGANQQLIATKLETPPEPPAAPETPENHDGSVSDGQPEGSQSTPSDHPADEPEKPKPEPGTLEIDHEADAEEPETPAEPAESETPAEPEAPHPQIHVDSDGKLTTLGDAATPEAAITGVRGVAADGTPDATAVGDGQRQQMTEPPKMATSDLTANTSPEPLDPSTEELSLPSPQSPPLLKHDGAVLPPAQVTPPSAFSPAPLPQAPLVPPQPAPAGWQPPAMPALEPDETLSEIEQAVNSPHLHIDEPADAPQTGSPTMPAADDATSDGAGSVDDARSAVEAALNSVDTPDDSLRPIAALNAQPMGMELHSSAADSQPPVVSPFPQPASTIPPAITNAGFSEPTPGNSPADQTLDMPLPSNPFGQPGAPANPLMPLNQSSTLPSAFPGAPAASDGQAPPPVPPPMLPPLQ